MSALVADSPAESRPLTIFDASVLTFLRGFANLSHLLQRAEELVQAGRLSEQDLVGFRLAPDMDPFRSQIQRASDTAKGCVMRLAGQSVPKFDDYETSLSELRERVEKTVALLQSVEEEDLAGSESRTVKINMRRRWISFSGESYLLEFAVPNFFFHLTIAYAILRHNGLKIGKLDYLGRLGGNAKETQR